MTSSITSVLQLLRMSLSPLSSDALCLWHLLKAKPNKRTFNCPIPPCAPLTVHDLRSDRGRLWRRLNKQTNKEFSALC